jgi:hypothetical protein
MFAYIFDNPREYNEILQFFTLFLLLVIGLMVYYASENTEKLKADISQLEMKCPACPEHPEIPSCPSCPTCPSLTCENDGKCPDCVCPTSDKCPTCPPCTANANCPTVDDIVSGIFPGRHTGVTNSGRFFDIKANESYELMPDYDFYKPEEAFPSDSILPPPLNVGNVDVPVNQMGNSMNSPDINSDITTTPMKALPELGETQVGEGRMAMGLSGNQPQPGSGTNNNSSSPVRSLSP